MDVKPIKTDADYCAALKEVESLMMAGPDTPEGEKLDVMVTLIDAYETKHFPMDFPDPVEACVFR
jgi:HTH-type transcriptional regulator / antitoxin HigA